MLHQSAGALLLMVAVLAGCGAFGPDGVGSGRPGDLGLVAKLTVFDVDIKNMPVTDRERRIARNEILSTWVIKSDALCSEYQAKLSRAVRDSRLATDITATTLSGLATIFTKAATIHPLSGAATIVLGVGGDIQNDLFLQQAGDVIANAIQTTRNAARKELQKNWGSSYDDYTLTQALADVQRYHDMCNVDRAINDLRTALGINAPAALTVNNPIIGPSPPLPLPLGSALSSAPGSAATPVTTITTVPAITRVTPEGASVTTSPQVSVTTTPVPSVPVASFPPVVAPPEMPLGRRETGRIPPRLAGGCSAIPEAVLARRRALEDQVRAVAEAAQHNPDAEIKRNARAKLDSVYRKLVGPTPPRSAINEGNAIINRLSGADRTAGAVCTQADMDTVAGKIHSEMGPV